LKKLRCISIQSTPSFDDKKLHCYFKVNRSKDDQSVSYLKINLFNFFKKMLF